MFRKFRFISHVAADRRRFLELLANYKGCSYRNWMMIHVVKHTNFAVLSAPNRAAFQQYVWELLQITETAFEVWKSAFEIFHLPWPEDLPYF